MQIYEALKKDHQEVRGLLAQLIALDENSKTQARTTLIQAIRDALVPHSRAEEAVFYNSLRENASVAGLVAHGYQEHIEAETILRTLQVADKVDVGWLKMAESLKKALEHHIAEEEGKIFTAAKQIFTSDEAEMLGKAFEGLKPEIKREGILATTSELIANMMPAKFSSAFRKYNLVSRIK